MPIWPRVVCGSTVCCLAHLWSAFSQAVWVLVAAREPSWFLHLLWSGNVTRRLGGVEESKFCLFSVVFPVRCISSVSPRFYFRRHAFCLLPLATIMESSQSISLAKEEDEVTMSAICLCRGAGQGDLLSLSLPDRPYEWFHDLEIPWGPSNLKGHSVYLTGFPKFLGRELHTVITCVPSLEVVQHTL
jgi:hypothetical protein